MINPGQQGVNEQEWNDPNNWSGPAYCRCYWSKRDTRLWVPKSNPALGWTINFGHKFGLLTMIGGMAVPFIMAAAGIIAALSVRH
ncbi:MAG: hypothetical protein KGK03_05715 [Candidatus Omnitrophica bacterium]|nr:hypothetical protein [Candidatus Omnitrophota bacterium]MDE2222552.1 hypothetical protein [Candidatus Omnitrophota bacterium]